jgi:4-amino-4-deoxychorismate lyase
MEDWVNGQPVEAGLSCRDRGLAYGHGLFETIGVHNGQPRFLDDHLQRLSAGCRRLAIPLELETVRQEILEYTALLRNGVAKLIITAGLGERGYAAPQHPLPQRLLLASPAPRYASQNADQGIRLFPCQTRLACQPLLAGLKHLNRLEQVLARGEWKDLDYAEGLMCDPFEHVVEGVFSNLFMVVNNTLITPSLDTCGVAGVMRAYLLRNAERLNIKTEVRQIPLSDFTAADEVFMCNSQYGVWPVCTYADHEWPIGPLTRQLQQIAAKALDF